MDPALWSRRHWWTFSEIANRKFRILVPPKFIHALIPAHNEAPRIAAVVRGARQHLPVLVVDDGSSDDTASVAEAGGAAVLRQTPNQGKGAALRAGFRRALAEGWDAALTLDADGQHDPAEIPKFLDVRRAEGTDLVIGWRDFCAMPPLRRLANTLGRLTLRWALGTTILDNQSGYRLISRRVMEAMQGSRESGFEFEVEMIATCVRRGWPIGWVPIRHLRRAFAHPEPGALPPVRPHGVAHPARRVGRVRRCESGRCRPPGLVATL